MAHTKIETQWLATDLAANVTHSHGNAHTQLRTRHTNIATHQNSNTMVRYQFSLECHAEAQRRGQSLSRSKLRARPWQGRARKACCQGHISSASQMIQKTLNFYLRNPPSRSASRRCYLRPLRHIPLFDGSTCQGRSGRQGVYAG
jgi:GMP synthase-like glutamine amidotransferase